MAQLLSCWKSTAIFTPGNAGKAQSEGASRRPQEVEVDELVTAREGVHLGLFQTEIIEGWVKPLLGDTTHVMIMPLKAGEGQLQEARPLPLDSMFSTHTHISRMEAAEFHSWLGTCLDSHIFLKKGVPVVRVTLASPVPPTELSQEMEAGLGTEAKPEPMSVVARQEKLLEKLNLNRLAHWSSRNAAVARELVLDCHDVFALESNKLGCTSAIEHEIRINNSKPFKEQFQHIPPPLLEEVHASLQDMLDAGAIHLS